MVKLLKKQYVYVDFHDLIIKYILKILDLALTKKVAHSLLRLFPYI